MPLIRSIAAKIFGLAVFLLLLTILLVGVLLYQVSDAQREIARLQQYDIPLQASIANVEESGLRRRLAFERWFGALNATSPNMEIVREASANYEAFSVRLQDALDRTARLVADYPSTDDRNEELAKLEVLLAQVTAGYPAVSQRQRELLALQRSGRQAEAGERINLLNDQQLQLQRQREQMLVTASALSARAADRLSARHQAVVSLTIAATLSAVLLGLLVAAAITLRLTQPVRRMIAAIQEVRAGNLGASLPVSTSDEIGKLTELFNYFVQELRAKEHVMRTFGRYIDPRVVEQVLKGDDKSLGSGERRRMTVMFADIASFSSVAEQLTPAAVVAVLNRHFTLQASAVQARRGVVDKFVGDAVLAFWGPPFVPAEEEAALAARSALTQLAALDVLATELPDITGLRREPPRIGMRIGIATGEVLVGNVGSETVCSYTVIGDTVNLASRIEGANKFYGTNVLVSDTTARELATAFELREIDTIAVLGKQEAVSVHELMGVAGEVDAQRLQVRAEYAAALQAYRKQDWDGAERGFRAALAIDEADGPSRAMLARVATFRVSPPPTDWNGVWRLGSK